MQSFRNFSSLACVAALGVASVLACSSDDGTAEPGAGSGASTSSGGTISTSGGTNSSSGGSTSTGSGGTLSGGTGGTDGKIPTINPDGTADCDGAACQCSNGIDDDGDGDVDGLDVECQGPADNDEGSFATGIPGDNVDGSWLDCFFDGNSGAGDDGCKYKPECLTGELDPSDSDCQVSQQCIDFCGARTPNGCDCFGCCTIQVDGESLDILTTTGCSIEEIDDEGKCPRCTKTDVCENTCGECELCPGRTVDDLPESCAPTGGGGAGGAGPEDPPVYSCDGGTVCSDALPCVSGYYCSLGCCIPVVK